VHKVAARALNAGIGFIFFPTCVFLALFVHFPQTHSTRQDRGRSCALQRNTRLVIIRLKRGACLPGPCDIHDKECIAQLSVIFQGVDGVLPPGDEKDEVIDNFDLPEYNPDIPLGTELILCVCVRKPLP